MTFKDEPRLILDCTNYKGLFEGQGIKIAKITEKISSETSIKIGLCPPFPFLIKFHDKFNIPFFSQFYHHIGNHQSYYRDSIAFYKSLNIKGLIIKDDLVPLIYLEKYIRDSRTNRLYTLVYSSNVAISAALSKFDPNAIAISSPHQGPEESVLSKLPPEMIENHVKRINIENPKVSVFSAVGINGKIDIKKGLKQKVRGFVLEIPYSAQHDPYDFLTDIIEPLRNI